MKNFFPEILLLIAFLFVTTNLNAQIKIDGVFFDWTPEMQLDVAPNNVEVTFAEGDPDAPDPNNPTYFADLDIEDVYATDDADFVYFRIKMNSIANVQNIPNDTSYHGGAAIAFYISVDPGAGDTTGLTWGWWGNGYDYFVQVYPGDTVATANTLYDQFLWEHKQAGNGWDFIPADSLIGSKVAWNAENNEVEFSVPKSKLFNPHFLPNFVTPENIAVMIYAGENFAPWRADYASNAGVSGYLVSMQSPGPIAVDGLFFDWDTNLQLDIAPNSEELTFANGDPDTPDPNNPSYFADLDVEDVFATDDDDFVYVRIKMNSIANILNIPNDTSYHGGAAIAAYISIDPGVGDTTGLTWGWWGSGYDYFVQVYPPDTVMEKSTGYPQALWEHKQAGNGWDFEYADSLRGTWVSWNVDNNDVEMAIPKVLLQNPRYLPNYQLSDSFTVMIYAGENFAPWRADYASNPGVAGYGVVLTPTDVDEDLNNNAPTEFLLKQNYPNPFNPSTRINYSLPAAGFVTLKVYNLIGEEIATLVNNEMTTGNHSVNFSANNLPSGIYICTLNANGVTQSQKMVLLK